MPSLKRNAADEAKLARRLDILSHFDKICKVLALHRKWIPYGVFAGVMNNLFHINVDAKELNKTVNICMGLQMDDPSKKWGNSGDAYKCMTQQVLIQYHNIGRYIFITFVIKKEKPSIEFGHW